MRSSLSYYRSLIQPDEPNLKAALVTGLCLGLGFLSVWGIPLTLYGLYRFFSTLHKAGSLSISIRYAALAWFIKSLLAVNWFWDAYPIDWIAGLYPSIQLPLIGLYWASVALWLSSAGAAMAIIEWYCLRPSYNKFAKIILAGLVFTGAEQIGAWLFSIATIGPGISPNSHFSFGFLGQIMAPIPGLINWAMFGGLYVLSGIFISMIAFAVYGEWQTAAQRFVVALLLFMGGGWLLGPFTAAEQGSPPVSVVAIDTRFDNQLLGTEAGLDLKQAALLTAVKEALALRPDYILLPEDSRFFELNLGSATPEQQLAYARFALTLGETIIIDSARTNDPETGRTVLRAVVLDGQTARYNIYDKRYLVPQGEFIPYLYGGILRLLGYEETLSRLQSDFAYRPGQDPVINDDKLPPVIFCFESVKPLAAKQLAANSQAPFIAHPISQAWFKRHDRLWRQLEVMLRVQAVWAGRPIISAGNMSSGRVYWPDGRISAGSIVSTSQYYSIRRIELP